MFRYSGDTKSPQNLEYVEGWRESQLLQSIKKVDSNSDRKFIVTVEDIEVEIDIHFIEAFMRSLKLSDYLFTGVRLDEPIVKGAKIDAKSIKPLIEYLKYHHNQSPIKMPFGSMNLLMSLISQGPDLYDIITEFEMQNKKKVEEKLNEKRKYRLKSLEQEMLNQTNNLTKKYEATIDTVDEKYKQISEQLYDVGEIVKGDKMITEKLPEVKEGITNKYISDIKALNLQEERKKEVILKYTQNTYSFYFMGFDLLVKKIDKGVLRYSTIYDIYSSDEPANVFLYILDYGDEKVSRNKK